MSLILTWGLGSQPIPPPPAGTGFRAALVARLNADPNLSALVADRIYPQAIPQSNAAYPAVGFRVPDNDRDHHLDGVAGVASARVELWAESPVYSECDAVAEALRRLFDGFVGVLGGDVTVTETTSAGEGDDYFEPADGSDAGTHQIALEYLFRYRESIVNR
jgi:hypothetical protein